MEIKRSDMIQWAQSAQLGHESAERAPERTGEVRLETKQQVSVDTMRSKVLSLQQEVRELQTGISMRQMQLGFLGQMNENASWQKELKRFMTEQFPTASLEVKDLQNVDEFRQEASTQVSQLRSNLVRKEIQIQNIISAGVFEPKSDLEPANELLVKDFSESREIFSKLRPDAVKSLVN